MKKWIRSRENLEEVCLGSGFGIDLQRILAFYYGFLLSCPLYTSVCAPFDILHTEWHFPVHLQDLPWSESSALFCLQPARCHTWQIHIVTLWDFSSFLGRLPLDPRRSKVFQWRECSRIRWSPCRNRAPSKADSGCKSRLKGQCRWRPFCLFQGETDQRSWNGSVFRFWMRPISTSFWEAACDWDGVGHPPDSEWLVGKNRPSTTISRLKIIQAKMFRGCFLMVSKQAFGWIISVMKTTSPEKSFLRADLIWLYLCLLTLSWFIEVLLIFIKLIFWIWLATFQLFQSPLFSFILC